MKLSQRDKLLLRRMKRKVLLTQKLRWVFVLLGSILIAMSLGFLLFCLLTGKMNLVNKIISNPIFYLLPVLGGISIGQGILGFIGMPEKELLIRVVEDDS